MATITDWFVQNRHIVATDANGVTVFAIPVDERYTPIDQVTEYCEMSGHHFTGET